jgi:hypothetical protein
MTRRTLSLSSVLLVAALLPLPAAANTVQVTQAAKLGPNTSQWGLQVNLVDSVPRNQAYVLAGPAQGFNDETTLQGTFFVNPQNVTMPNVSFQMVDFLDSVTAGGKTLLIFHLCRSPDTTWRIHVWHWNENLNGGAGGFQFSGGGFFALANNVNWTNNRIDFSWTRGNPGSLTLWRTRYINGAPDASGTIQMFTASLPGMQSAVVNYAFAGMFASHDPGTSGTLYLDEFSFSR